MLQSIQSIATKETTNYRGSSPCDKKSSRNTNRIMMMIMGFKTKKELEESVPVVWFCPIQKVKSFTFKEFSLTKTVEKWQGESSLKAQPKKATFDLLVPSFLSKAGTFLWNTTCITNDNGKSETFLTFMERNIVQIN